MPSGGTPLLPITKVGPGDKERAYVLRQNCVLKFLLGLVCCFSVLSTVLIYTRYEVHVQRRNSIEGARSHREEEHAAHMRVMRLSMLLQNHLEDEVHDGNVLTTYRAWLMRAVGDYQLRVLERAEHCNCSTSLKDGLKAEGAHFDTDIEKLLKLLWDDVVREGKTAQKQLHNITHAIVAELRQDATEQGAYERVMQEAGEDAGMLGYHNHEVDYHGGEHHNHHHRHHEEHGGEHGGEHGHDPYHPYGEEHGGEHPPEEHGEHHAPEDGEDDHYQHHEGDDDDEEHLAGALEALMHRLEHNESVVLGVSNATIDEWSELHESSLRSLSDEEQEVDLQRVNGKIGRILNASHAVLPPFPGEEHGSMVDYLGEVIHKAKLAPFRDELLGLLHGWQDGALRINIPLNRIEELIDEEVLEPDVLVMRGDYEHYRYDD